MVAKAVDTGIQKLYHYESFSPKYLKDTLVNQRVHFSNPENFNDPWDCYPCFDMTKVNDPAYRKSFIALHRQSLIPGLNATEQTYAEARLQADSRSFEELIRTTRESYQRVINQR